MERIKVDKEELTLAVNSGKTGIELQKQFNCGKTTLYKYKKEYNLLNISQKGSKIGTKHTNKYSRINSWTTEDDNILSDLIAKKCTAIYIANELGRTENAIRARATKLGLKFLGLILSNTEFLNNIKNKSIIVLDKYINYRTKLSCKCKNCGYIWKATPQTIIHRGKCPLCSDIKKLATYLYLIYFPKIDLYKIGISNNINKRFDSFGFDSKIIILELHNTRHKAYLKEQVWLANIKDLKVNTGLLNSGNTETFMYD